MSTHGSTFLYLDELYTISDSRQVRLPVSTTTSGAGFAQRGRVKAVRLGAQCRGVRGEVGYAAVQGSVRMVWGGRDGVHGNSHAMDNTRDRAPKTFCQLTMSP